MLQKRVKTAVNETPAPYAHWMLREIFEQPSSLTSTLERYVAAGDFHKDSCDAARRWLAQVSDRIVIAASGSSRHAAMLAELMIENASGIPVDVEYASEYLYRTKSLVSGGSLIAVSQSGETADTLAVVQKANAAGQQTLVITNVGDSSMAREAAVSFPTDAGPEKAVPATKSFTAQLLNLYLLALLAAQSRGTMRGDELSAILAELARLPMGISRQLPRWHELTAKLAEQYDATQNFLYLGRDLHYPVACEGALKLKESAYLHAEGYPSGELKHGPNALLSEGTALVMLATRENASPESMVRYHKVLQLARDMRAQGVNVLAIANTGDREIEELATHVIPVSPVLEPLLCICETIPLQLLAYNMALRRGVDMDRPRNLTKAVLAE